MIRIFLRILIAILLVASFSDAADKAKIIAKDDQYLSYENGIIYDEKTNIEWLVGPDKYITWDDARAWIESLSFEGGGWRLPTKEELESLYKKGAGERNMTRLLKTTGWRVWSNETEGPSAAWYFNFYDGDYTWGPRESEGNPRVFAVRSRR
ncbi:MAG: DUF1566 domain-containing protein [Desulfobacterales bacterium]|nr:MAG: DUF1566 domain-containing protein [Desulfobacterales bacterium]